jgi:UDP-GlcNAc:undecaprenyl-phosphate/decaprenyl-phosphate GlcNAc-1-phosphate transferase
MHWINFTILFLIVFLFIFLDKITKYVNYYDYPDIKRKIHKIPISKLAGIIIFLICLNIFIFEFINNSWSNKFFYLLIFSFFLIFLLNILDDYKSISANIRLFTTTLILFFFFSINENFAINDLFFSTFEYTINLNQASILFSVLCILLLSNAINLSDGFNGISISHFLAWYIILFNDKILVNYFHQINFLIILVLLILNIKNRTFIGNSGTACLGFFISIFVILNYHSHDLKSSENIFLIFLVPGVDMLRVFIERIFLKKNPFIADKKHLHHLLIKKFNNKHVLPFYLTMSFAPILSIYIIDPKNYIYSIILSIFFYIYIIYLLKRKIKNV